MKILVIAGSIVFLLVLFWLWVERGHLLLPGTWPALKWLGFRRTLTQGLHGIWYGRHIVSYLNFLRMLAYRFGPEGRYARWLADSYHGKILPPELARSIITVKENVPLQDLGTRVIPYARARDIVLKAPVDIVVTQCGCKALHAARGNPCRMVQPPYMTCMLVGKPLTDFLLDHKPENTKRISRDEALALLEELHDAGLVHTAWFKDCIKDQFYVICNCCSCCCLGFEMGSLGIRQLASSGYVAAVDAELCEGCGVALEWCPFDAIEIQDTISAVRWDACMGCGICVAKCPHEARRLITDRRKGLPLDVRTLPSSSGEIMDSTGHTVS
ncbi:MAG: 4Fe-4S binding protein [Deltaproteobacteria bacterium]|nr:4Fe-4S binding protein [Deltaproteobacteria bacterium]